MGFGKLFLDLQKEASAFEVGIPVTEDLFGPGHRGGEGGRRWLIGRIDGGTAGGERNEDGIWRIAADQ